jgi:spermidine/putrescine transport system permease protein
MAGWPMSDFLTLFLAVLLALLVAPLAQGYGGRIWGVFRDVRFVQRNGVAVSTYMVLAVTFWILLMIVLPQLYMVDFSFRNNLPPPQQGGPDDVHTLKNYHYLLFGPEGSDQSFNWLHLRVFAKTIIASVFVTLLDFALCYPIAYYIAQVAKGGRARLIFLCLLLPFWVNEILRAFAFRIIFGTSGVINSVLIGIGLLPADAPIDFLRADIALYSGLSYAYVLMMVFPLYNAIESLDHNQIEAARDLGSPWWRIHWRVVMPHAKPGIASGCVMVFMLAAGALATPQILGGPSSLWFTQVIYDQFFQGFNWPRGSAYAFVLLVSCVIFVMSAMRAFKVNLGDIAR